MELSWGLQSWPSGSQVHVVDAVSGVDKIIYDGPQYSVIDFSAEGIYLQRWTEGRLAGLALLNPAGGEPVQITTDSRSWTLVGSGAAWAVDELDTVLERLDLKSLAVETWLHSPAGDKVSIVAVDAGGAPFVLQSGASQQLLLVPKPDAPQVINDNFRSVFLGVSHDTNGIWFGGPEWNSVSLYTPETGLVRMATIGSSPSQDYVKVAGGCA